LTVDAGHCLTCRDTAVAATVVEVDGVNATVEFEGEHERVGIELVGLVAVGDTLLCHAGIALQKLTVAR